MTSFEKIVLKNGLKVLLHQDSNTPMVVINILYNVGAKDEHPDRTGFAHLFEHLMFGGSLHAPMFDTPLELAGGQNNAFTNNDLTNYYEILPEANIETALWLESDRMMNLNINHVSLDVQKKVVVEEFKEHYLNQPYGDAWHNLRKLAYKKHPYQWPTIGSTPDHITNATLSDVQGFYDAWYNPSNAILVVAGNIDVAHTTKLVSKWFENIPDVNHTEKNQVIEPVQKEARKQELEADVPVDAMYKAWHMCNRMHPDYEVLDLASDILSNGKSSRFYQNLIKEQRLFSDIDAYITGSMDNGLFVVAGKTSDGVDMQTAEMAIEAEINHLINKQVEENELQKVKNKIESAFEFGEISLMTRAFNLAYYEMLGDAHLLNRQMDKYLTVSPEQISQACQTYLHSRNCSTLYYKTRKPKG